MPDRIACCMPGCRRSCPNRLGWSEWICQRHWSAVPKDMRRAYAAVKRRRKSPAAIDRIWRRCKSAALREAFMGF